MTDSTELITEKQLTYLKELIKDARSNPVCFDWQNKTALMLTDDWRKKFLSFIYPIQGEPCFKGVFSHWDRNTKYKFEDCGLTRDQQREDSNSHAELLCVAYSRLNDALMNFLLPTEDHLPTLTKVEASEWITALKNPEGKGCGVDGIIHTAAWYSEHTDDDGNINQDFINNLNSVIDNAAFPKISI